LFLPLLPHYQLKEKADGAAPSNTFTDYTYATRLDVASRSIVLPAIYQPKHWNDAVTNTCV
jgi:hypothetical protein